MLFVIRIKRTLSAEVANPEIDEARKKYKQVKKKYIKTKQQYKREKKIRKKDKDKSNKQGKSSVHKKRRPRKLMGSSKKLRKISKHTAHGMYGHINNDSVLESCSYLGYEITRMMHFARNLYFN